MTEIGEVTEVEKKEIDKAKVGLEVGLVVCAGLVVVLAIASIWLFIRVDSLQNQVDSLTVENDYLRWEIDEARFDFYYDKPKQQKFGVYDLEDELVGIEWLYPHQEGVFDCSEMSAYLERYLENKGWRAKIVVGDSPFSSGGHAWLLVETSQGKYMPVESTNIEIVWWDDSNFDNYLEYDRSFETIQEATAYSESEFDWWK